MKFSSLAAPKVAKMATFGAASDENFIKMTIFPFQCTVHTTCCCSCTLSCDLQLIWRSGNCRFSYFCDRVQLNGPCWNDRDPINGLMQRKRNSSALTMELRLFRNEPSRYWWDWSFDGWLAYPICKVGCCGDLYEVLILDDVADADGNDLNVGVPDGLSCRIDQLGIDCRASVRDEYTNVIYILTVARVEKHL